MKIGDFYGNGRPVLSFEVFPPKKYADIENIDALLSRLAALSPDFISVTCGAGGAAGGHERTLCLAASVRAHGVSALAHVTCVGMDGADIRRIGAQFDALGIENVLALRGDVPQGEGAPEKYPYAARLIRAIRREAPQICIGAACYPEGHIECDDLEANLTHLREKQDAGADFLITQLFFDNELFCRFRDGARVAGVRLPISAGVMPILSRSQIERMIFLCGASLPSRIIRLVHRYADDPVALRQAGIEYAACQARDLARSGADGIHIYTMNHPDIAQACAESVRGI